jgi:beta-N-acetylhexosaminidase
MLTAGLAVVLAAPVSLLGCAVPGATGSPDVEPAPVSVVQADSLTSAGPAKQPDATVVSASAKDAKAAVRAGDLQRKVGALSDKRLAAQVVFGCADSTNARAQRNMAAIGVGGIVLLGSRPPRTLRLQLRSVQKAAPQGHSVHIASDEEGGTVQRLAPIIYRLPSAETVGEWDNRKVRQTATNYAKRMASLGVGISLAPVADIRVPGSYLDKLNRAYSSRPKVVGKKVSAWASGTRKAGVTPVLKHWPGHGHAADTHKVAARVPALKKLRKADLIPFERAFADGSADAVMVAHVQSKGLTKSGQPATQSKRAIRTLRKQAGPDTVIMTDSLSMAAASSARGLSESQAVVAALRAGVDWAMVCTNSIRSTVSAITKAIKTDTVRRTQLRESAVRVMLLGRQ